MKKQSSVRNIGIDLLRGVSILYIVGFWHLFNYTKAFPDYNNWLTARITLAILGTFVFVSGYFIGLHHVTLDKHRMLQFYQNRILRIYPLYLAALFMFTALHLSPITTSAKAAFLLSMFVAPAPNTLWFITMLLLYYLVSPLITTSYREAQTKSLLLYSALIAVCLLAYSYFTNLLDIRIIVYFPSFAFGIYVANRKNNIAIHWGYQAVLAALAIGLSFVKTGADQFNLLLSTPMIFILSYIIFNTAYRVRVTSQKLRQLILWLSYVSYCMYLFHRPFYKLLLKVHHPKTHTSQLLYLLLICLPAVLIISYIIQKTYDFARTLLANIQRPQNEQ